MDSSARLEFLITEARRRDPDRGLCALLAPADARAALLGLILLNDELARIPETIRQPMAGMIRFQWWRDAVREAAVGQPRAQPIVEALAAPLHDGRLPSALLEGLIDAREQALDPIEPASLAELEREQDATAGTLQEACLRCLGGADPGAIEAVRLVGRAFGLVGSLRSHAARVAAGRSSPLAALVDDVGMEALLARADALLGQARGILRRPAGGQMAAFLPARLAAAYARRLRRGQDPMQRPPFAAADLTLAAMLRRF